jgi:hypothetical protein
LDSARRTSRSRTRSRTVAARLTEAGVRVTNLLEPLRRASAEQALYHDRDWHLNASGHRIVGEALEREIIDRVLLGADYRATSDQASSR